MDMAPPLGYCFVAAVLPVGLLLLLKRFFECRFSVRYSWSRNSGHVVCMNLQMPALSAGSLKN